MLRELSIRNFAIIDDLRVAFSDGLTIFSGETGAGKSIIIHAVNLLLGGRAASGTIRSGAESAELEALFDISPESPAAGGMARHGWDCADGLVVRRIISRKDRHRIYINGRLSTLQMLTEITENLASISGQHAHQNLLKEDYHLMLLDSFGGLAPLLGRVRGQLGEMMPLIAERNGLLGDRERRDQRRELMAFQCREIRDAAPAPGEDASLERERVRLSNARALQQTVYQSLETLYDRRGAVVEQLAAVQRDLASASAKDPALSPAAGSIDRTVLEIEDAVEALRAYAGGLQSDAHRLETVEDRLDTLRRLKRKYGGSLEAVAAHLADIEATLSAIDDSARRITAIEADLAALKTGLLTLVRDLSARRHQAARRLSDKVARELASLKMAPAGFEVRLEALPAEPDADTFLTADGTAVTDRGIDRASFLIAPNPGEALKPLAAIASGGELSRVVLALKAILAETDAVETVVFDEVDAGIGGGVAEVVGRKLAALARHHQVICITHLPQIARFGEHHFRISKQIAGGRTHTVIEPVDAQDRIAEIARMLGGETITPTTLDHAKELLEKRP